MRRVLINTPELRSSKQNDLLNLSKITVKKSAPKYSGGNIMDKLKQDVERVLAKYKDSVIVLRTEQEVEDYFNSVILSGYLAIDTETTGLNCIDDKVVGTCLYFPGGKACYIPHLHTSLLTGTLLNNQISYGFLKSQFERAMQSNIKIIMHNASFDLKFIYYSMDIKLTCYWDTMLAGRLMNTNQKAGLKELYAKYIEHGKKEYDYSALFKGVNYQQVPPATAALYAAIDALKTYKLFEYQVSEMCKEENKGIYSVMMDIEMPLVPVVFDMEVAGICIDADFASTLSEKYNSQLTQAEKEVHKEVNKYKKQIDQYNAVTKDVKAQLHLPINISSPTQLAKLFYDVLKTSSPSKKSPRGTGEDELLKIGTPLCKAILKYRGLLKLISTYIDKLPKCVSKLDNRLHANFVQIGADTGRFSSKDPNLQNIPSHNKEIRKMFVASPGCVFVDGDFSQQEPRLLSKYSGDENMTMAYKNNRDLYATVASKVYGTTYEDCLEFYPDGTTNKGGKERRSSIKSVVLGIMYGRGVASVAEQIGRSTQEAQEILYNFYNSFPRVKQWMEKVYKSVTEKGYSETLWGRRRHFPEMQLPEYEFNFIEPIPLDFNPLVFTEEELTCDVPNNIRQHYIKQLNNAKGFKQVQQIMENAKSNNIAIKDNTGKIAEAKRQCVNAMIQGAAADMSKLAMINVANNKRLKELGFKMLLVVHDEIMGECPEENAKECGELLCQIMKDTPKQMMPEIPFKVDPSYTKCWYGKEILL